MVHEQKDLLTLVAVGDVSPNRDDPPSILQHCGDVFRTADIVFGQMESPLSDRGTPMFVPHTPCRLRPKNISALTEEGAGFDIMSFSGDTVYDLLNSRRVDFILSRNGRVMSSSETPITTGLVDCLEWYGSDHVPVYGEFRGEHAIPV